ncbi:ribokinase [Jeongeupia sp. HS-3]|uniref:ribokinase n=1 Tax=Jeongeupia sp. HS-3 TaxID=1009682 RepID=UPI0018A3BCC9|nr:ribokinase [Jeongeupia sp. HS-3]BCL76053.1 ribokinase [Jeongeupia sp. HS-3]
MTKVLVVGSINMDLVVGTAKFPRLGETLFGEHFATYPGGKGANQAVAAARLGAQVTMIGRVGDDAFGQQMLATLGAEGIDTRWIGISATAATGIAAITVCDGDNAILVIPGANGELSPAHIAASEAAFADADVVLAQLEVPMAAIEAAAALAAKHGKPFILNPAPAASLPIKLIGQIALFTPNEYELAVAFEGKPADWKALLATLPGKVVMTKGRDGAWFTDAAGVLQHQPSYPVAAVDSTGAGDTFNGAIAAFWDLGLAAAARYACAAGALSVTRPGAQGGMPTRADVDAFLATRDAA